MLDLRKEFTFASLTTIITITTKVHIMMIVEYLDQSFVLDDDLDDYRIEIAEKLGVSFDREKAEKNPYQEYLKTESGVYA